MKETPDDLVARGYVSRTKAETAAQVCGKVFILDGQRCAVMSADIRCDWFHLVREDGVVIAASFNDLKNGKQDGRRSVVSQFKRDIDHKGEHAIERFIYEARYSDVLEALRTAEGRMVA